MSSPNVGENHSTDIPLIQSPDTSALPLGPDRNKPVALLALEIGQAWMPGTWQRRCSGKAYSATPPRRRRTRAKGKIIGKSRLAGVSLPFPEGMRSQPKDRKFCARFFAASNAARRIALCDEALCPMPRPKSISRFANRGPAVLSGFVGRRSLVDAIGGAMREYDILQRSRLLTGVKGVWSM